MNASSPVADTLESLAAHSDLLSVSRQADMPTGNDQEFAATIVMLIALDEAACKEFSGPPVNDARSVACHKVRGREGNPLNGVEVQPALESFTDAEMTGARLSRPSLVQ